ncbi:MAG: glycosyltransferase [Armatimonadota bacterium]|nr:glycosyltransferase [Armatimonadota bacterium]MDR7403138.1 glycosyltransferase [Armatimonadota bacterium]
MTDDARSPQSRSPAVARSRDLRVAIVHDWLVTLGGADRVLLELHNLFPHAPVFTALHRPGALPAPFRGLDVRPSWLQRVPGAVGRHRLAVPLLPLAFRSVDLRGYHLVVSSSHACAHGVRVPPGAVHICYCHTPMRYAWDLQDEYVHALPRAVRPAARGILAALRAWDRAAAQRVDVFVANSRHVAGRIRRHYGRDAVVIYPPVDTDFFTPAAETPTRTHGAAQEGFPPPPGPPSTRSPVPGTYYLVVSRLVPYKRVDLAVEAFTRLRRPLVVVGDGPERRRLEAMAGPGVRFVGEVADEVLREYYRHCRALVFPGVEDFGLVPVEAQACGRPVIALRQGGALESVVDGVTGLLFSEPDPEALASAVRAADGMEFDPRAIRAHAERFSRPRFRAAIVDLVETILRDRLPL